MFWVEDYTHVRRNPNGKITHYEGIILNITERKRAEEALETSRVQLSEAMDLAHLANWEVDIPAGIFTFNDRFYAMYGTTAEREGGYQMPVETFIREFIYPDDAGKIADDINRAIQTTDPRFESGLEQRIIRRDGAIRHINVLLKITKDAAGRTVKAYGANQDITERKRAEEEIRLTNVILKTEEETSPDGILIVNESGKILMVNRKFSTLWSIPQEIIESKEDERVLSFVTDKLADPQEFLARVRYLYEHREEKSREEVLLKDGTVFDRYSAPMIGENNQYFGRVWYFSDITERKQAEEALERSHAVLKSVIESPKVVVIFALDRQYRYIAFNETHRHTMEQIWGADIALGLSMPEYITSPEDRKKATDNFDRALSGESFTLVEAYGDTDLERRWFENAYNPITDQNGNVIGLTLFLTDVTERKRMEQSIIDSRQLFINILSFLPDPTLVIDDNGRVLAWNHALEELSGVPAEEMIGKGDYEYSLWQYKKRRPLLIDMVLRPDMDVGEPDYTDVRWEGSTVTAQSEVISPVTGQKISISIVASPLIDLQGKVTGAIESLRDISGIKAAETALARLNANLEQIVKERTQTLQDEVVQRMQAEKDVEAALDYTRSVIEASPDLVVVLDEAGIILDVNAAGELLTGIAKEQLKGTPYFGYLVEDGTVQSAFAGLLEEGRIENFVRIRHTNGHVTPLSVHATVIRGMDGKQDQIIVAAHDITRQKQDEEAIRSSRQILTNVLKNFPGIVFWKDKNSVYLGCNRNFSDGAGLKDPEEIIGKTDFDLPWAKTEAESYRSFDHEVMDEGKPRLNIIETQLQSNGRIIWLDTSKVPLFGSDGTVIGILGTSHDITRQKHDEEAIKASLEEKVILLREVHHRVKNNLQIIISLVNLQMRQTSDPEVKRIMSETQNRVRAMSLVHEKLYRSESLSRIDFADYTRFLATQLLSFYGVDTRRVGLDFAVGKIMVDINTAVPLGLLMNELISNALKHAFPQGREGMIRVSGGEKGDLITLAVQDNGVGMPEDLDWKNTSSLGMRLITSLTDQVDGTITLDREKGTTFTITIPLKRDPASS